MIPADQISPDSDFYKAEPWLKNIPDLILQGNLKSAWTVKKENKSLDTDDLEDYYTGILRPAAKLKQKEEIMNTDGTISQVTPVPIKETKLVAMIVLYFLELSKH